ncbi:hypothetical protein P0R31_33250 [Bradyrhizobium yuanmingense]|uniref:hypothetical protein n=1 Tax=Bradyrhizobium yuanmingense TaxID=108015 RepID=UPI0023B8B217|nr:hypothetical protein [Bradyrhizobium yuanmingense]MDF0522112.1 hypothetical protein [Bradyrhizobium yuanmingense]
MANRQSLYSPGKSKAEAWEAFSNDWQAVLDHPDPAPVPGGVLKTKDIYRNRVPNTIFYGWTDEQRDERLKMFIRVINRHVMHGIISVIPIEPYQRLLKGKFKLEMLDQPYFISFFGVLIQLVKLTHRLKLTDKIELIFDEQAVDKTTLTTQYDLCMSVAPPELKNISAGMPIFKSDSDVLPLQASDLIAWHARRYYYDLYRGKTPEGEQSNVFFANMCDLKHDIVDVWTEDKLIQALSALQSANAKKQGTSMTIPSEFLRRP